ALLLTINLVGLNSFAQQNVTIFGSVTDANHKIIESATVSLLNAKDTSIVKFTVADKEGRYILDNVSPGKYYIAFTAVGYSKSLSQLLEITGSESKVDIPSAILEALPKSLGNVTVTARKPLIEQKIDRTVVNVEASVTNVGATALEVLEKSPGITIDKDGNISLKGKEGVMVMIDGRPTQLGGTDLANLLRNMNSNQLEQIEIMTNPPARFDAAGNAGVINIKTKKNKAAGYNGSATVGFTQGRYPRSNEGFNFNYKEGKVNVFSNLSHNYRRNINTLTIQRNLLNSNTKDLENYFDQRADMVNQGNSYSGKIGVDYFANKKTSFGIVLNGFSSPSTFRNRNKTMISNPSKDVESVTRATVDNTSDWKSYSSNFNFRTLLDTTGRELTSDVDLIVYDSKNGQVMINSYFNAAGNGSRKADTLHGSLPQNIKIKSGRIDYFHPIKNGAKFEAGIKSSIVTTDNNARYDSIQYGRIIHDFGRSNYFIYEENINAAYVNLSTPLSKKINAQLGLRLENTNAKGNQLTTGEEFDRHYSQLFPTAYFQYKANDKNNIGFNYGRRIRRPNYESLNPFIRFLDRYTYQQGNPNLKPQLSNNIELSHTYKNFLTTTINYSTTNDILQMVVEQKGQEAYAKQDNIASLKQIGIAISANAPINKWWTNSIYVNVFNNHFKGTVNNEPISFSAISLSLNGSQQFKLSKTLTGELSGFYRSAGIEGVIRIQPMGMLSAGFSQQVLKNLGTIRLTVRDIFLTQKTDATIKYGNVDASFQEVRDSRVLNIGFTYRFSKGKINGQKKRTNGSASEEQNRVGVGN
ncbi:MAG TPA: TonB-dependent receptor, partial [Flavisolibacter sp.]|nr:TonB-dependent receptor [Flavisolibacter sp.]